MNIDELTQRAKDKAVKFEPSDQDGAIKVTESRWDTWTGKASEPVVTTVRLDWAQNERKALADRTDKQIEEIRANADKALAEYDFLIGKIEGIVEAKA
jgi:glutathione S-transferase